MRIKKIEIEGFKSYSQREVVDYLDAEFNAITGLNGSGKSNILDSICFLLGITNLAQVRVHSFNELVYKQGQAGISRATVTITFDNDVPPDKQPAGYSKYKEIVVRRQIIINGKNTYQINGISATNQRVSDMFRQGRITKVLNMKPMEILSMVEEAAGVRMYECKKQSALRTIDKKECRFNEISRLIDEEINPKVIRLKKERANYLEYKEIERTLELLTRKMVAYDYYNSKLQIKDSEKRAAEFEQEADKIGDDIGELSTQIEAEQLNLKALGEAKAKNMGPEMTKLENELKERQNVQAKADSEKDEKESNLSELRKAIDRKQKSLESDKNDLTMKRRQLEQAESEIGDEEHRGKSAEEALARARQKLEALAKGMTTDDEGNAVTLEAQLTATRTQLSEHQTNVKKAEMRLGQLNKTLSKKRNELQQISRRSGTQHDNKQKLEAEIAQLQQRLRDLNYEPELENRLEQERTQLANERTKCAQELDRFEARNYKLRFDYTTPYNGFDRSKVKGVVAKLFKMCEAKYATALEVVAGGRLFNIVIDQVKTGEALLRAGLPRRVTMIPLDKTSATVLDQRQIGQAKRMVGEDSVFFPKELINYEREIELAILSIFGNCLICVDMDQAKQLTFDKNVHCRTVTLSGEDFKPSGVLTGGFRRPDASILLALNEISGQYERIREIDHRIGATERELARLKPLRQQYDQLNGQLIVQQKRLDAVNEELKNTPAEVIRGEIARLEDEVAEANAIIEKLQPEIDNLTKRVKELEGRKTNEGAFRENEKRTAQNELANAQKELEQLKGTFSSIKESLAGLREEIGALENSIKEDEHEIEQMNARIDAMRREIGLYNEIVMGNKDKVKQAQQELEMYNKELRSQEKQIRTKTTEIEELKKRVRQLEAKFESKRRDGEEAAKNATEFAKRMQQLEKTHSWIAEEKQRFGVDGSAYDFRDYSYEIGKRELDERKARTKELLRTVNPKAMDSLGTAENELNELLNKRQQLEKDKKQLYDAIEQLDEKKRTELLTAHKKITADFSSIYSTLLPGASAELVPPSGAQNCLAGLEVRVAFNGKNKDSLAELSGGQRSLVALSLILAMLKFKPAPFYILDEIDAALDISHTENIGKMIKNHFSESQFIVVSLKQGFFDNANVVYRVNFRDGRSVVTRTENRHT
uniref:SMC hinge domain-containing protein n=1 Tax=Globodera rostochiensis TaxID=31243 RepID=A0A914IB66_GLORO